MTDLERITACVEQKKDIFLQANKQIFDFAELAFEEIQSAATLCAILRNEGFTVEEGLAEMPTCFTGTFTNPGIAGNESEKPVVVGFLGEFDALDKLNQQAGTPARCEVKDGAPGHGCGHCLLGTGALAAAVAVKDYLLETGKAGTVIYFGCPAEEGAGSKQFMARAGLFDGCDFVLTWHPSDINEVPVDTLSAIMGANFHFYGTAAHAGGSPWAGRSALDACELMNVGCNYLREHIRDGERIHYAYGDAGGTAPNVVPDYARIKYEVRAPKTEQVKETFARVVKVAEGAALMTETKMEYEITMAFSDTKSNEALGRVVSAAMQEVGAPDWTADDFALAAKFSETLDEQSRKATEEDIAIRLGIDAQEVKTLLAQPLHAEVLPYRPERGVVRGGSSDVGDVTYCVPTCELHVAGWALGTIGHTWQITGQAGSVLGEKGMLTAAKILALSAVRIMDDSETLAAAKAETDKRSGGSYSCPLPDDVRPPVGKY